MTMTEIFLGKDNYFPGLLPLVNAYLEFINCDSATFARVNQYLQFIERCVSLILLVVVVFFCLFSLC
jgi:glutamate--cysteine ligase catalytic subunit